jgi:hypothetical protein
MVQKKNFNLIYKQKKTDILTKAFDTLEDPGSSILSYCSQIIRGSSIMLLKNSHFLMVLMIILNFNPFLFNTFLLNELILLNPRSYVRKET